MDRPRLANDSRAAASSTRHDHSPLLAPKNLRSHSAPLPRGGVWGHHDDDDDNDDVQHHVEDEDEGIFVCAHPEECSIAALRQRTLQDEPEIHAAVHAKPLLHIPYLPFLALGKGYFKKKVWRDIMAGLVGALVAIPQGLAYSVLASLPAEMGLYTSSVPPLVFGFLGTSRHLSVGPVAVVSMFLPSIAVSLKMNRDPELRIAVAAMASIVSGVLLILVGICRLGSLVKFISSPVLAGFTTAAVRSVFLSRRTREYDSPAPTTYPQQAVVIGVNQTQHYFGYAFTSDSVFNVDMLHDLFQNIGQTNPVSLLIGTTVAVFLATVRHYARRYKKIQWLKALNIISTLLAVILSTLASYVLTKHGYTLPIVGAVTAGLPRFSVPSAAVSDLAGLGDLVVAVLPVTCLAFMSSWSLARNYATKCGQQDLDANQEAVALGAANLVAGFFHCFPSSGSFGRTSLNAQNGARSPLSNVVAGVAVLLCLLFFTPLLHYLPMACLGAIIQVSLISLFDLTPFKRAYKISKPDFVVTMTTFLFTALVNIEVGLVVGIFVSIAVLLQELSEIHTSTLVPVPTGGRYYVRSQSIDPVHLLESSDIKVVRLTASLFFGNQEEMKTEFEHLLANGGGGGGGGDVELGDGVPPKAIVIDASGVSHLDLSGVESIEHLHNLAQDKGVKVAFVNAKGVFRERLKASKLWAKVGGEAYDNVGLDEVVNQLYAELVPGATLAGNTSSADSPTVTWGSPKVGAVFLPTHHECHPVLEGSEGTDIPGQEEAMAGNDHTRKNYGAVN